MASASSSSDAKVPRLAAAGGAQGGAPHSIWRPQMQTFLMRQGIEKRDYAREIPHWKELAEAVAGDAEREEEAAIRAVLARSQGSAQAVKAEVPELSPEQRKEKACAAEVVVRTRKAYAYLYAALPADLRTLVADVPQGYAFGIWNILEKKFRNTEQDSVMTLWKQFTTLEQEADEDFVTYKARVDSVHELLTSAKQTPQAGLYASLLLWSLQPRYATAVLTLKTGDRLKDVEQIDWPAIVEYMGQYERSQHSLANTSEGSTNTKAFATRHVASQPHRNSSGAKQPSSPDLSTIQCFNCKELGHYRADCKKPDRRLKRQEGQWQKKDSKSKASTSTRRKQGQQQGRKSLNTSDDSDSPGDSGKSRPKKTELAHAAQRRKNKFEALSSDDDGDSGAGSDSSSSEAVPKKDARTYAARVCAGLKAASDCGRTAPKATEAVLRKPKNHEVVGLTATAKSADTLDADLRAQKKAVDTAATVACTGNRKQLVNFRPCDPIRIKMGDGSIVTARHKGDLHMRLAVAGRSGKAVRVKIKNVYFHERIDANLLSWGCMREEGWELHSTKVATHLVTPGGRKVNASTLGRLTILEEVPAHDRTERMNSAVGRAEQNERGSCTGVANLTRLHQLLGHVSWTRLIKMCRAGLTAGIGDIRGMSSDELRKAEKEIKDCAACAQGKQRRKALGHGGLDKGSEPGEVLHMDTFYVSVRDDQTGDKRRLYCLLATDGFTEWRWAAVCHTKVDLQQEAINIIENSTTLTGRRPRLVISDLGSEFDNGKVRGHCSTRGVKLQPSPARAKELNGVSEKSVDTVKNHVRTMLIASGVPTKIAWQRALVHHVYVWNRSHIGRRSSTTPYSAMVKREPNISNLGIFGCDAYVHQHPSQRDTTFTPKAEPGIYLGHDVHQNAPAVFMLGSEKVIVAKDVSFREGSFKNVQRLRGASTPADDNDDALTLFTGEELLRSGATPELHEQAEKKDMNSEGEHFADVDEPHDHPLSSDSGQEQPAASSQRWAIRSIQDSRVNKKGQKEYQVRWSGYSKPTWEPATMIDEDAPEVVRNYEKFLERSAVGPATRSRARTSANTEAISTAEAHRPSKDNVPQSSTAADENEHVSEQEVILAARDVAACRL
jgi:transposase InsO family protein